MDSVQERKQRLAHHAQVSETMGLLRGTLSSKKRAQLEAFLASLRQQASSSSSPDEAATEAAQRAKIERFLTRLKQLPTRGSEEQPEQEETEEEQKEAGDEQTENGDEQKATETGSQPATLQPFEQQEPEEHVQDEVRKQVARYRLLARNFVYNDPEAREKKALVSCTHVPFVLHAFRLCVRVPAILSLFLLPFARGSHSGANRACLPFL